MSRIYCFEAKQSGEWTLNIAPTLRSMNFAGSHLNGGGQLAVVEVRVAGRHKWSTITRKRDRGHVVADQTVPEVQAWRVAVDEALSEIAEEMAVSQALCAAELKIIPFDTTQITHPENRSNPQPGDPSPTLAKSGNPPHLIGFYPTGGSHGVSAVDDGSPALKVGSALGIPSPPAVAQVAPQFDRAGTADPVTAHEHRTYTHEGKTFRLRNVVADIPPGAYAFKPSHYTRDKDGAPSDVHPPLSADADKGDQDPVVFVVPVQDASRLGGSRDQNGLGLGEPDDPMFTLQANSQHGVLSVIAPRRLTPTECARLQGFPDWWLDIDSASDSAKYRALGNAVAVPCVSWIARRLVAAHKELYDES